MTAYFLQKHVYVSDGSDALIFLDLKNDVYVMINGKQADAFRAFFWQPVDLSQDGNDQANTTSEVADSSPEILKELVSAGLLTTDRAHGKPVILADIDAPARLLGDPDGQTVVHIDLRHVWRFFVSCFLAASKLHVQRIEITVKTVQRRKIFNASLHPMNWEETRRLVAIFHRLRSFFPANYLCLFDSLAMIEFLARYNVFPTWVFAVQFEPWQAHCWVQEGEVVFNECVERAERYTPIMTI